MDDQKLDERLHALTGPILDADGNPVEAEVETPLEDGEIDEEHVEVDQRTATEALIESERPRFKEPWTGPIPEDATPENCPLTPARGHLVIVRESPAHERGRLIVPKGEQKQRARELMAEVWIMAVGEDDIHISGAKLAPCCKVGDRCITRGANPFATHVNKGSKTIWELVPFDAVVAVLDEDVDAEQPPWRSMGGGG